MLTTLAIINMAVASVLIADEVEDIEAKAAQEPVAIVQTIDQKTESAE